MVDLITPQLDRIENAIEHLKLKDQRVAQDHFNDAILAMKLKFSSGVSADHLRRDSDRIDEALTKAKVLSRLKLQ